MRTLLRILLYIVLVFLLMVLGGGAIGPWEILLAAVLVGAVVFGPSVWKARKVHE